ncbi:hypothetical protein TREPR_2790 [Treponema primitia ZAS-2]|uniref:Uncharacterized protein n=1 Tax=Treponema primitia (strain ATCC BAA-887 / DSM 12427 / ZAS-2) TaxID=545694 RepID=F5YPZ8_TREPZ|nr:hypothetical protein TREPR_2790 [Treponema primitia ZAS-2]
MVPALKVKVPAPALFTPPPLVAAMFLESPAPPMVPLLEEFY